MLDIPDSGAVFIIGDSYLKNNQENYFFIKNDPILKIYANYYGQNGVVCESGRLYVWGHNQYGQLGIGTSKEVVSKPTVVKEFRDNNIFVKDVAFGYQFTVVLSEDNKIYFAGRTVFPPGSRIYSLKGKFQSLLDDVTEFTDLFCELAEFDFFTELETLDFHRVFAGGNHFVVQTKCGQLIGWGLSVGGQLGQIDGYRLSKEPVLLPLQNAKFVVCGNEYTMAVTEYNEVFVTGKFNHTQSPTFTKLNTSTLDSTISKIHVSIIEEICIITERNEIYISKSRDSLQDFTFYKLKLLDNCDKIKKLESGSNFLAFVTNTERFFTNYRDTSDADYPEFHELDRFRNFRLQQLKCGANYILLKGVPRLDAFGLNESRVHKPLLSFTEDYADGFSEASTDSVKDVQGNKLRHAKTMEDLHKAPHSSIRFIENNIERRDPDCERYFGPTVHVKLNAKDETRKMIMAEPIRQLKHSPKVRIKTPLPKAMVDSFSGSGSTTESDHSVDDELNRKVMRKESKVQSFFRRIKERAIEFEESCKDTKTVIADAAEMNQDEQISKDNRQKKNELKIGKQLPSSFVCSIQ